MTRPKAGVITPVPSTVRGGISAALTVQERHELTRNSITTTITKGLITMNDFVFIELVGRRVENEYMTIV